MINLDPALLDQDKIRKEKRKELLKRYSVPFFLLVLIALFFLSTWIYNLVFLISYDGKNFPIADGFTETRFFINILEPYIADYNQGTARLRMGQYEKAEESFTNSLQKSPAKERLCQIYVNLSLSIEFQADTLLQKSNFNKALGLYGKAESVLYNNNCAKKGADSSGEDSKAEAAKDRLNKKRGDAADKMNNTQTADDDINYGAGEKQISDDDLKKVQEQVASPSDVRDQIYDNSSHSCPSSTIEKCF